MRSLIPAAVVARRADAIRAVGFAFGFLMLSAALAAAEEPIKWTVSISGGSKIEIPVFFAKGDGRLLGGFADNHGQTFDPIGYPDAELRQYRAGDNKMSPFEYLKQAIVGDADKVTYKLDRPSLAAVSGTSADGKAIFYGMCQKRRTITCFDMVWNKKDQATFGPIAERIARSFRKNR
ncbi:hypothetical protein C1D09_014635 [Mesorhizobium intechi]|uniref:Uncharacterized protein n=1 Tax=Mesorhizobium intechi TaxID=537601 RepID=A0A8T9ARJ2_9HYPH|nr:hypothetical protein [Mesorhizobium intechi]TSE10586.1 hypothetical protein C1D09_014635 [Mesorhizobium intechi]